MQPNHQDEPRLLTVREVAELLRVSPSMVYQLVEGRKLACHRIGGGRGAIRVSTTDIQQYLAACRYEQREHVPKPPRQRLKHLKL